MSIRAPTPMPAGRGLPQPRVLGLLVEPVWRCPPAHIDRDGLGADLRHSGRTRHPRQSRMPRRPLLPRRSTQQASLIRGRGRSLIRDQLGIPSRPSQGLIAVPGGTGGDPSGSASLLGGAARQFRGVLWRRWPRRPNRRGAVVRGTRRPSRAANDGCSDILRGSPDTHASRRGRRAGSPADPRQSVSPVPRRGRRRILQSQCLAGEGSPSSGRIGSASARSCAGPSPRLRPCAPRPVQLGRATVRDVLARQRCEVGLIGRARAAHCNGIPSVKTRSGVAEPSPRGQPP